MRANLINICSRQFLQFSFFVQMCQPAQRVQGHPHAPTKASQDIKSSSTQATSIDKLIEAAYQRQELLRPEQWSRQTDDRLVTRSLEWDTSRQSEYLNDGISSFGERKLLEGTFRVYAYNQHRNDWDIFFLMILVQESEESKNLLPSVCAIFFKSCVLWNATYVK